VGDSVVQTHFWPGRGLNSGIKLAAACAISIAGITLRLPNKGIQQEVERLREFIAYSSFANELSQFEISRSNSFLCQDRMTKHIENAQATCDNNEMDMKTEISNIKSRAKDWFERRVQQGIWPLDFPNLYEFLELVDERLRKLSAPAVALLSIADGWPAR